ncbi:putative ABC transport system permease protein [Rhizobium sp. BK068]|nr:putative ABC transport system permease protein [Rhizobium sp. BK068]
MRLGSARAADRFDLVIGAAGSENQLVLSSVFLQASPLPLMDGQVLTALSADPRVAWAAPIGFGDSFRGYPIVGTTTALVHSLTGGLSDGKMFAREGEAVIGAGVTLKLDDQFKPMHGSAEEGGHTHTQLAYHVVGRLKPTGTAWDRAVLVPIQAVWHIHGMGGHHDEVEESDHHDEHDQVVEIHAEDEHHAVDPDAPVDETWDAAVPGLPAILVKPKTIADAYKLRQQYRAGATVAVFPAEVLTRLYATLGDAKRVLFAVAAGSQTLVAASLLLVTVMHVGQRRRQIGALRAFGAPRRALFSIRGLRARRRRVRSSAVCLCGTDFIRARHPRLPPAASIGTPRVTGDNSALCLTPTRTVPTIGSDDIGKSILMSRLHIHPLLPYLLLLFVGTNSFQRAPHVIELSRFIRRLPCPSPHRSMWDSP